MEIFITGMHITLCFFLILVVLLQPGKGADFGAAMGGSSGEVFGASGGVSLLGKLTAGVAAMFMATSLTLAWFSNAPPGSDLTPEALEAAGSSTQDPGEEESNSPANSNAPDASLPEAGPGGDQSAEPSSDENAPIDAVDEPAVPEAGGPSPAAPETPAGE